MSNEAFRIARLEEVNAKLVEALDRALALKSGWREAIVELEDHCSEPVRLKNMIAAADQLDIWAISARAALAAAKEQQPLPSPPTE